MSKSLPPLSYDMLGIVTGARHILRSKQGAISSLALYKNSYQ